MIIANILLIVSIFFLIISFLVAINPIERITNLYGILMIIFAVIFLNLDLEENLLTNLTLTLILTKIILLIIITKYRK